MGAKNWTLEEDAYLIEKYGELSIKTIAKNLGRTVDAINVRKVRLHLGSFLDAGDYITFSQLLCTLYNQPLASNAYRATDSKLWATAPVRKKRVNKCSFRIIYIDDFWKWAEENKNKLDFSKLEENALGAEPDWVKIKRKADYKSKRKKTPWTKAEDKYLERLLAEHKFTYSDLEEKFNRNSDAIRRRIYDLALDDTRPVKEKRRMWTEDECARLIFLKDEGYSLTEIAKMMNRSGQSIRGKLSLLEHPEMYLRRNRRKIKNG